MADEFDDLFARAKPKSNYPSDQSAAIPDGDYDCEIKSAVMKETKSGRVFTFTTTIIGGEHHSKTLEHSLFFFKNGGTDEEKLAHKAKQVEFLKKDFETLGFDADNWTAEKGRSFGTQYPIACSLCVKMRVKMRKKVTDTGSSVFLNKRQADLDGKPAKFGAAEMVMPAGGSAPTSTAGQSAPVGFGTTDFGATSAPVSPPANTAPPGTSMGDPLPW